MIEVLEETAIFVLEDDIEGMTSALDSDLDAENKRLNQLLIKKQKDVIAKIKTGQKLTKEDMNIIKDANEIHINDTCDFAEHHVDALKLDMHLEEN